jgi:hypothetical protein
MESRKVRIPGPQNSWILSIILTFMGNSYLIISNIFGRPSKRHNILLVFSHKNELILTQSIKSISIFMIKSECASLSHLSTTLNPDSTLGTSILFSNKITKITMLST